MKYIGSSVVFLVQSQHIHLSVSLGNLLAKLYFSFSCWICWPGHWWTFWPSHWWICWPSHWWTCWLNTGENVGLNSGENVDRDIGEHVGLTTGEHIGQVTGEDVSRVTGKYVAFMIYFTQNYSKSSNLESNQISVKANLVWNYWEK